ncbi:MAG: hypothetical protein KA741_17500, partial [Klebsiella sp.]|nr:hypothetical protein [Klebsiella sp.]
VAVLQLLDAVLKQFR